MMHPWNNLIIERLKNIFGSEIVRWLIILGLPAYYFYLNFQFTGPAYLQDEIGYLAKAAYLAGFEIDGSSSYYSGYAFVLAPLFRIFTDNTLLWRAIMAANAILISLSLWLIIRILKRLFNQYLEDSIINLAIFGAALYPSIPVMVGYAFPSCFLIFIFTLSVYSLTLLSSDNIYTIIPFALASSLFFWTHPTGVAIIGAAVITLLIGAWESKQWKLFALSVVVIALSAFISMRFQSYINDAMTPAGNNVVSHYPTIMVLLKSLLAPSRIVQLLYTVLGQSGSLLIATFGLPLVAATFLWQTIKNAYLNKVISLKLELLFILFGSILLILVSAATLSSRITGRGDYIIYQRYIDSIVPVIVAISLVYLLKLPKADWRLLIVSTSILVLSGFVVDKLRGHSASIPVSEFILVNIPSFWPYSLCAFQSYFQWFLIGGVVMLLAYVMRPLSYFTLLIIGIVLSITVQAPHHKRILTSYSTYSPMIEFINETYDRGTCIGYDELPPYLTSLYHRERYNLLLYYLHQYKLKRSTFDQWLSECDGPLLTYKGNEYLDKGSITFLAKDLIMGISIINKIDTPFNQGELNSSKFLMTSNEFSQECLGYSCYKFDPEVLGRWSQVGEYNPESMSFTTTRQDGLLFYGPNIPYAAGSYRIMLSGDFLQIDDAYIEVVINHDTVLYKNPLDSWGKAPVQTIAFPYEITEPGENLQVKIHVTEENDIAIKSFTINLVDD